jgi:hypothetical protein
VDPELISSLILGSEGLGRGIERESEGSAGRRNSDWFTSGERVGFAGNILRGDSEGGRVDGGMGDTDRMLRGPIGLCTILVSIARSLQFDVQRICGSFQLFDFCCAVIWMLVVMKTPTAAGNGNGRNITTILFH